MGEATPFSVGENVSVAEFLEPPVQWNDGVLGALCFSMDAQDRQLMPAGAEAPYLHVPLRRLDSGDPVCEVWHGSGPLNGGQQGAIRYRYDEGILMGVMALDECDFNDSSDATPLQQAAESGYRQIFALAQEMQFPYLFRFWNYIADINGHSAGLERYRQFNLGRQKGFVARGREIASNAPAACALGMSRGSLSIAFLLGRVAPRAIENPRQVSAYQYPSQYGPSSPTFARASLVQIAGNEVLLISGTASIVGHTTLHMDDVVAQTHETINNIEAVLAQVHRGDGQSTFTLADLHCRVYVRHPTDLSSIQAVLAHRLGGAHRAVYLQADICRDDLLVEIEATAGIPLPVAPLTRV